MRSWPKDAEDGEDTEAEQSTSDILARSAEAADRIEAMLNQSEELLERLRSKR